MRGTRARYVERQARRMHEMMDVLDVDGAKLARLDQGSAYAAARLRCLNCSEAERCVDWLETATPKAAAPDFCPNVSLFEWASRDSK